MRSFITSTLSALFLLSAIQPAVASPLSILQELEGRALEKRCDNPCGADSQLCCGSSQACYTNSLDQAECTEASGGWQYYTTVYTETETETQTVTSVWSSRVTSAASSSSTGTCSSEFGYTKCGTKCCEASEECVDGTCVQESSSAAVTGEATPAARGTSSGWETATATATASATTTEAFIAPVSTDGSELIGAKASSNGGGLSGGAIAGIVIGTIAGVFLLFLLCACICFKEALDGLLALIGLGGRRKRKETVVEERYSHHSHGSRPRPSGGRTWFGTRPAASNSEISEKKSKWSGWGTVAIILGALALCLGLRRHEKEEHSDDRTDYTYPSSYYYYSDYTRSKFSLADCERSACANKFPLGSDSSGRRTRDTRRSRRSRTRSRRS